MFSREKAISFMINLRSCYGQSFFFFSFFFFNDGTTGIGEENCASLHVSKNRDNFQVSWTWTHSIKFPAIKKVISGCAISKKKRKKAALVGLTDLFMFLHSQRDHHSKNNKRRSRVNNWNKFAFSLTSEVQEPSAFHSESSKQVPRSWITSTRLQAEISKLAWPRTCRSHPARSTRVYNVLAYFYADYFDAGTPVRNGLIDFFPPAIVNSQIAQVDRPKIVERMVFGSSPLVSRVFVTFFLFQIEDLEKF